MSRDFRSRVLIEFLFEFSSKKTHQDHWWEMSKNFPKWIVKTCQRMKLGSQRLEFKWYFKRIF